MFLYFDERILSMFKKTKASNFQLAVVVSEYFYFVLFYRILWYEMECWCF